MTNEDNLKQVNEAPVEQAATEQVETPVEQTEAPVEQTVTVDNSAEIAELNAKIMELTNDLQRTRADFENYRRQADMQKEHYANVVKNATVQKVLPLIDDMDRAIAANESLKPLEKNLNKTLKDLKLERIESKAGSAFDPDLHNAVMVSGDGDKEVIAETLCAGYRYEGEIIRPALVKVEKK